MDWRITEETSQVMVGEGVAPFAATTEPDMAIARNRPSGEIAPRRGNVHDVGRTVTSPTSASSAERFYEVLGKRLNARLVARLTRFVVG